MKLTVLMSGADHFAVQELNPYSRSENQPDTSKAIAEHTSLARALTDAGIAVTIVPAPTNCPDGVYTANWALVHGDTAILSSLPGPRQGEEAYAEATLRRLGKRIIKPPYRFSGQGDALVVGPYLLVGTSYRTDPRIPEFLAKTLRLEVVSLHTVSARDDQGRPVINPLTGWPDSLFYDLDLAIAVLRPDLIAWCPTAFDSDSQAKIRALSLQKIEVSYEEATRSFACNLISTGTTAIMSATAPLLQAAIEAHGLTTITPHITELSKGGGYIRCTSLTLSS